MSSSTMKVDCPMCGSDDCNYTVEQLGQAIQAKIVKIIEFCNKCTYTKVRIIINSKDVFSETKPADSEDTELIYSYLGRE